MNTDSTLLRNSEVKTIEEGLWLFETLGMPARDLAPRTRKEYKNDIEDLRNFLTKWRVDRLDQIGLSQLESYQAEMDNRGYKSSTRRRKTLAIKVFFKFLYRQKITQIDIASQLIPPAATRDEPRWLSREEYERLLRACSHNPRDAAIIELFLQTGMRLSELSRLTLNDVELPKRIDKDPDNVGIVRVRRKGGKNETIPLNYKACRALKTWLGVRPSVTTPTLFVSKFKRSLSNRAIQYVIENYLKEAKIVGASVHTLRHTTATHHAMRGTDAKTIQETLGHASLKTTELYISMAKNAQRKALQDNAL